MTNIIKLRPKVSKKDAEHCATLILDIIERTPKDLAFNAITGLDRASSYFFDFKCKKLNRKELDTIVKLLDNSQELDDDTINDIFSDT